VTNNITSEVRLIHQEGGSTFVTTGALAFGFSDGFIWPVERTAQRTIMAARMVRIRRRHLRVDGRSDKKEAFTREA